jgi:hypothetical protein
LVVHIKRWYGERSRKEYGKEYGKGYGEGYGEGYGRGSEIDCNFSY